MIQTNTNPRIVIAGAGSIGFFIGGLLLLADQQVSFLARERMVDKVKSQGLHLTDYAGLDSKIDKQNLDLQTDHECLKNADIILVTVKSAATKEMARLILQHAKPSAIIISLQNGISNSSILKEILTSHSVLAGVVPFNVAQMDNARFHRGTSGNIIIEASKGAAAERLTSRQLIFEESSNIKSVQSGKLLINLNNALNALSGLPLLEQLSDRDWRQIMAAQMSEALAVLKKAKLKPSPPSPLPAWLIPHILRLPTPLFKAIAKQMLSIDPLARSSMWEDLEQGRKTEVAELQGEIIRLAKQHNLQSPINNRVLAKIREAELSGVGSPHLLPKDI